MSWSAASSRIYEKLKKAGIDPDAPVGDLSASACSLCGGKGHYMYDENHGKPCEQCCPHDQGWWNLTEHHAGFVEGGDNRCCRAGCGMLYRDLKANSKHTDQP